MKQSVIARYAVNAVDGNAPIRGVDYLYTRAVFIGIDVGER